MKVNKEEILSKLLKDKLEKKLLTLEQHTEMHLKCVQGTMIDTNKITETCVMLYKEVLKHKNDNNERNTIKQTSKSVQKGRNIPNKNKFSIYNSSYPANKLRNSAMTVKKNDNNTYNKTISNKKLCPSKSNGDLLRFKKKNTKMKGIPKNKSCSNLTTAYRCDNNNSHCNINNSINKQYKKVLNTYTNNNNNNNITRNKTPRLTTRTLRQSKDLSNMHKKQRNNNNNNDNIRTNKRNIHTISNTKLNKAIPIQNNDDNNNINIHNQSLGNISNILTIETNLQSDLILNKEDSLLFLPISDIDYLEDKNNFQSNTILNTVNTTTPSPLYYHFITYFSSIVKYLSIYDLTPLALVNKSLSTEVYTYIKQSIESDIKVFTAFISNKPETTLQLSTHPITIHISKGTSKASMLLNGPVLNKIFLHKNELPHVDSLRIFKIYFTLISHDISKYVYDNHVFWEKTCDYFINSDKQLDNNNDSKIGSLVLNTVDNNLQVKYSSIYKVIRFIKGNENKILPGYFSKKCGTTGLFAFFVKDILDAYGLNLNCNIDDNVSYDIPKETYLTYVNIIQLLKEYIDYLNKN